MTNIAAPAATKALVRSAGHALPPLAFCADEGAENQRESQANCKVMPKHFPAPFILSTPAEAHPNRSFVLER
jgi:hypothetical protein